MFNLHLGEPGQPLANNGYMLCGGECIFVERFLYFFFLLNKIFGASWLISKGIIGFFGRVFLLLFTDKFPHRFPKKELSPQTNQEGFVPKTEKHTSSPLKKKKKTRTRMFRKKKRKKKKAHCQQVSFVFVFLSCIRIWIQEGFVLVDHESRKNYFQRKKKKKIAHSMVFFAMFFTLFFTFINIAEF